jgi:hypothetical protein
MKRVKPYLFLKSRTAIAAITTIRKTAIEIPTGTPTSEAVKQ